jgi:hypothetical protein
MPNDQTKLDLKCSRCSNDLVEADTSGGRLKVRCRMCGNDKVRVPDQPEDLSPWGGRAYRRSPLPPGHLAAVLWLDGCSHRSLLEWTESLLPASRGWRIDFRQDSVTRRAGLDHDDCELHLYRTTGWFKWKKRYELRLSFRSTPSDFKGAYVVIRTFQPEDLDQFRLIYTFLAKQARAATAAYVVPSETRP